MIAYNEAECLEVVAREMLREVPFPFELVLVDDGSKDATLSIMERLAASDSRIVVVPLKPNRGIGGALRAGFDAARGDFVTWVPADGQIAPSAVLALWESRHDAPLVNSVYRTRADAWYRLVISRAFSALARGGAGAPVRSGGTYLFRRELWREHAPRDDDSMMISAAFRRNVSAAGIAIAEIEIDARARVAGSSKVLNARTIVRTLIGVVRAARKRRRG